MYASICARHNNNTAMVAAAATAAVKLCKLSGIWHNEIAHLFLYIVTAMSHRCVCTVNSSVFCSFTCERLRARDRIIANMQRMNLTLQTRFFFLIHFDEFQIVNPRFGHNNSIFLLVINPSDRTFKCVQHKTPKIEWMCCMP